MRRYRHYGLMVMVLLVTVVFADEPVDLQVINKIKREGFENSRVMEIASYMTDVYGPRLTGSPNLKKASEWARDKLAEWGLENAHLESWGTFGRGWSVERYSIELTEPQYLNLIAYPKAWTPGTNGLVSGQPLLISLDEENLEEYREKIKGAIIMLGDPRKADPHSEPDVKRYTEEELIEIARAPQLDEESPREEKIRKYREERAKRNKIIDFLTKGGAAVVLQSSSIDHGTVRVDKGGSYKIGDTESLPTMVIAMEHYNRILRMIEKEIPVKLEINIQVQFHEEDSLGYNVVAEIPGSDSKLKKELVMLGAHFDSWHAGTGAVDNAAGSAVMMETVRILKAIGIKPRRTIRIALWSGEEQGLLGSKNYVANHFGDPRTGDTKPDHANFSAYFNVDNGSGKIRGIYLQSNDAVRPVFEDYLKPFHDLGATTVTIRDTRGTDHLSFDAVGLPGFQFIQDPLGYSSRNWHTNMDVYDHLQENDLKQIAVIVASFVYHTAMRDEKIPRKPLMAAENGE